MDSETEDSMSEAAPLYADDEKLKPETNGNHMNGQNGHADVQL